METKHNAAADEVFGLTGEQILMLQLSDQDIAAGRLISQEDLDKIDMAWLQGNA
jgi:hypothetical protein